MLELKERIGHGESPGMKIPANGNHHHCGRLPESSAIKTHSRD